MKKIRTSIVKKLVLLFAVFVCTGTIFAQNAKYKELLAKAKQYESKQEYAYALGFYYDAMEAEPTNAVEAVDGFTALKSAIVNGKPGLEEYDEFSVYDGWVKLLKNTEKYWTEYCPYEFEFGIAKGDLNYASKTCSYYVGLTKIGYNYKAWNILENTIIKGFKNSYKSDWTGIPKSWPQTSIYYYEASETGKSMIDGAAIITEKSGNSVAYCSPAWNKLSHRMKNIYLYDVKLDVVDETGTVLLSTGRYLANLGQSYAFTDVNQSIMKKIDSGKVKVIPKSIYLEYGNLEYSYLNNPLDDYVSGGSRQWLKKLPELQIPMETTAFDLTQNYFALALEWAFQRKRVNENITSIKEALPDIQKRMIPVKAGSFTFGSKQETKGYIDSDLWYELNGNGGTTVTLTRDFEISSTEFTCADAFALLGLTAADAETDINTLKSAPCTKTTWGDAVLYCNLLSIASGFNPCYTVKRDENGEIISAECDFDADGYRLPTEAEWEYAAKGGSANENYLYAGSNYLSEVGWYSQNTKSVMKICTKKPNSLGLYDMSGNVWEWCFDTYDRYNEKGLQEDATDYVCLAGDTRIAKGGSYHSKEDTCQISSHGYHPWEKTCNEETIGFRLVRTIKK